MAKNNTISYNHFIDTVQRLSDTAPVYTLGNQPGTTITNNYMQGVPSGHKYGLHPDEGSGNMVFRDNVLSVDKNITWLINSDDWGRKHDLSITQTYGPINKVSNKDPAEQHGPRHHRLLRLRLAGGGLRHRR